MASDCELTLHANFLVNARLIVFIAYF